MPVPRRTRSRRGGMRPVSRRTQARCPVHRVAAFGRLGKALGNLRAIIRGPAIHAAPLPQFPDGEKRLVAFDGDYRKVYEEVDNELGNESEPKKVLARYTSVMSTKYEKSKPMGAAKIPLTSDVTVAVDNDYIPLGAVLLAEVPILDEQGNLIRMDLRFVLAQDTGSKIQGTGHVDLYMGEGDGAKNRIKNMNKYGRVWLLLPKEKTKILAQNL